MTVDRVGRAVLALVVVVFVGAGLHQAWTDGPTIDEGVDLSSGLSVWVHRDLRMNPEHPHLPRVLAAAPALLAGPIVPEGRSWSEGDWFEYTDDLISANDDDGRLRRVLFLSRLVPLAEALAVAAVLARLATRMSGPRAGLVAAGAWLTMPMVLAFGHVQSIDMAFALSVSLLVLALLRHREHPSIGRAAVVGVALAATLATRHSALVLVPVALVALALSAPAEGRERARQAIVGGAVGWIGLWVVYRAVDLTAPAGAPGARFDGLIGRAGHDSLAARLVLAVPAPQEWRAGLAFLVVNLGDNPAFLAGRAWDGGRWWYFPAAIAITTPLLVLGLLAAGTAAWVRWPGARYDLLALVAVPAGALFAFTAAQPLDRGVRLVLAPLALWVAIAAAGSPRLVGWWRRRSRPSIRLAAIAVVVVQVGVLLSARSHSFPWQPVAFRPGYQWVSDSNIDFGQDVWRVREWVAENDAWFALARVRGLDPGPQDRNLVGAHPAEVTGWAAVGTTALTTVSRDDLAWLRAYCPVATLGGGSVLLYRFDEPPTAAPGPDRPVDPCWGEDVSRRTG